jgi:hypothetical protein
VLQTFTIYEHPKDHPEHYVVRRFEVTESGPVPSRDFTLHDTLEQARESVAKRSPHLMCFERAPDDDPVIVETWL